MPSLRPTHVKHPHSLGIQLPTSCFVTAVAACATIHLGIQGVPALADPQIIYVKPWAGGANDGTSWDDAFVDLQDALTAAASGSEIWVAGIGWVYTPTGFGGDRAISFVLKNGVGIYGGFDGTEALRSQRDWELNETVLSGDLNGDDDWWSNCCDPGPDCDDPLCEMLVCSVLPHCCGGAWDWDCAAEAQAICPVCNPRWENSFHVVRGNSVDASAVLDGFTIVGGGIHLTNADPTISNCTFVDNLGSNIGGQAYLTTGRDQRRRDSDLRQHHDQELHILGQHGRGRDQR